MKDLKSKDSYEELKAKRNPSGNCPSRRRYSSWKRQKRQLWQQRRRQIGCCTMWPDSLPTSLTPDEAFTCSKVNKCNFKQFQFIWFTWKDGQRQDWKLKRSVESLRCCFIFCWGCSRFVPFPQACVLRLPKQEVVRRLQFHRMRRQTTSCGDTTSPVNFEWLPSCTSVIKKNRKAQALGCFWHLRHRLYTLSTQTHHIMCGTQADDPPAHGLWNLRVPRCQGMRGTRLSGNARHAGNGWPGGPARPPGAPKSSARLNRVWSAWATKPQEHLDTLRPALPVTSCHYLWPFFKKKLKKPHSTAPDLSQDDSWPCHWRRGRHHGPPNDRMERMDHVQHVQVAREVPAPQSLAFPKQEIRGIAMRSDYLITWLHVIRDTIRINQRCPKWRCSFCWLKSWHWSNLQFFLQAQLLFSNPVVLILVKHTCIVSLTHLNARPCILSHIRSRIENHLTTLSLPSGKQIRGCSDICEAASRCTFSIRSSRVNWSTFRVPCRMRRATWARILQRMSQILRLVLLFFQKIGIVYSLFLSIFTWQNSLSSDFSVRPRNTSSWSLSSDNGANRANRHKKRVDLTLWHGRHRLGPHRRSPDTLSKSQRTPGLGHFKSKDLLQTIFLQIYSNSPQSWKISRTTLLHLSSKPA